MVEGTYWRIDVFAFAIIRTRSIIDGGRRVVIEGEGVGAPFRLDHLGFAIQSKGDGLRVSSTGVNVPNETPSGTVTVRVAPFHPSPKLSCMVRTNRLRCLPSRNNPRRLHNRQALDPPWPRCRRQWCSLFRHPTGLWSRWPEPTTPRHIRGPPA